jgi:glycosyltransferase involved in cell wall biosynthesis
MKIVHLTSHIGHGGDWTVIRTLLEIFEEKGHQVMVGGCRANSTKFKSIEMPLTQGLKGFIISLLKFKDIPSDTNIIHVHNPISLLLGVSFKYLRCSSAKIIYTYHLQTPDSILKKSLKTLMFKIPAIIHSTSEDMINILSAKYKINKEKNKLIYIGTNSNRFCFRSLTEKNQLRAKYSLASDAFILLFVGRLDVEKNISLILHYFQTNPPDQIILLLAGEGPLKSSLQQECRDLGIEDRVRFLGRVEEIEEVYSLADLLVLPSFHETFGLVIVEAAFCGLPSLRSDTPGAKDQISHGEDGFIFPIQQPEKMFEVLDQIWDERSKLPEIGQKARDQALEKFTLEKMYERFLDLYQK